MTAYATPPYTCQCDYCQREIDMGLPYRLPKLWTRVKLSRRGWVDICPDCLEEAAEAFEECEVRPIRVISDKRQNKDQFKRLLRKRADY